MVCAGFEELLLAVHTAFVASRRPSKENVELSQQVHARRRYPPDSEHHALANMKEPGTMPLQKHLNANT